jgi:hypothetical protein
MTLAASSSEVLPSGRVRYTGAHINQVIGSAKFRSRSHNAVIRVYDEAGNIIATHKHKGAFVEP